MPGPLHSSAKEGNYTDQPEMAIRVHDQSLEMLNFHPPHPIVQGKSPSRDITTCHTIDRDSNPPHPIEQGFCRRGGTPHRLTASATIVISNKSIHPFVAGEERRIG